MRIKIKPPVPKVEDKPPEVRLVPSPHNGVIPPVEHRWKPGQSGNPSGRAKIVQSAYQKALLAEVEHEGRKLLCVDVMAQNLVNIASTHYPANPAASVSAAKELRSSVEPEETAPTDRDNFSIAREVLILMMDREKRMEVRDI